MRFLNWLYCKIGKHDWTNKLMDGETPTKDEFEDNDIFYTFCEMRCKRCNKISKENKYQKRINMNNYTKGIHIGKIMVEL